MNEKQEGSPDIIYLCNGNVPYCTKKYCYKNGGECRHTPDVRYAKNFYIQPFTTSFWEMEELPQDWKEIQQRLSNHF